MESRIIQIPEEDWKTLVRSVTKMEIVLAGSGMGDNGLVVDLDATKKRIQKIEDKDNQRKGVMWVLGILYLGFTTIGLWLINRLSGH